MAYETTTRTPRQIKAQLASALLTLSAAQLAVHPCGSSWADKAQPIARWTLRSGKRWQITPLSSPRLPVPVATMTVSQESSRESSVESEVPGRKMTAKERKEEALEKLKGARAEKKRKDEEAMERRNSVSSVEVKKEEEVEVKKEKKVKVEKKETKVKSDKVEKSGAKVTVTKAKKSKLYKALHAKRPWMR